MVYARRFLRLQRPTTTTTTTMKRLFSSFSSSSSSSFSSSLFINTFHRPTNTQQPTLFPSQWSRQLSPFAHRALSTKAGGENGAGGAAGGAGGAGGGEGSSIIRQVQEGAEDIPVELMTTAEKVKEGSKTTLMLGLFGLVLTCGGLLAWELRPTKFSPQSIFDKALSSIREHPDVTMRIGTVEKGYGTGKKKKNVTLWMIHYSLPQYYSILFFCYKPVPFDTY